MLKHHDCIIKHTELEKNELSTVSKKHILNLTLESFENNLKLFFKKLKQAEDNTAKKSIEYTSYLPKLKDLENQLLKSTEENNQVFLSS